MDDSSIFKPGATSKTRKEHDKTPKQCPTSHPYTRENARKKHYSPCKNLKLDQCKLQVAIFPNQPTNQPNPQNSSFWMATTLPLMTFNPAKSTFQKWENTTLVVLGDKRGLQHQQVLWICQKPQQPTAPKDLPKGPFPESSTGHTVFGYYALFFKRCVWKVEKSLIKWNPPSEDASVAMPFYENPTAVNTFRKPRYLNSVTWVQSSKYHTREIMSLWN